MTETKAQARIEELEKELLRAWSMYHGLKLEKKHLQMNLDGCLEYLKANRKHDLEQKHTHDLLLDSISTGCDCGKTHFLQTVRASR